MIESICDDIGIGTDIEDIERFKALTLKTHKHFLERIFTENELNYCFSKKHAAPHLAVRYAGKEAVIKALSSMGNVHTDYKEIEILNDRDGVPMVRINNNKLNKLDVRISLSHCSDKAIALVIATNRANL